MIYECKKCLKKFGNRKDYYLKHINRKTECNKNEVKENIIKCEYCEKKYKKETNLNKHLLNCVKYIKHKENKKQNMKINKLYEKIDKLIEIVSNKKINNININEQHNNINIINISELKYKDIDQSLFIEPILSENLNIKKTILEIIKNIHINDKNAEYMNIYVSLSKTNDKILEFYIKGEWKERILVHIEFVLDNVVEHSQKTIEKLFKNNQINNVILIYKKEGINKYSAEYIDCIEDENDKIKHKKKYNILANKTIQLFYDNRDKIKKLKI